MTGGVLPGVGAARGLATGRALVLRHGQEPSEVPAGAVVVARILHPHLAPLLLRAGAVVVEEGAVLQHATTLAREFGLAAVVGVRGATEAIQDGEWLEVDGDRGLVRRLGVATAGEGPK